MEHANKFKAGDFVIAKNTSGGLVKGKRYTVEAEAEATGIEGSWRWVLIGGLRNPSSADGSYLESAFDARDTAVKKGDKFRVNKDCQIGGFRNGDVFVAVSELDDVIGFFDNEGDLRLINREHVTFVDDFGDPWDYKPALKIERRSDGVADDLVEELAGLRIQAGKSYRTRDGRKVGPMKCGAVAFIVVHGDGFSWEKDGKCFNADGDDTARHDLIAEWIDEPVAAAPESKFKVGDRVRVVVGEEDAGSEHGAEVGEEHIVTEVTSDGVDTEPWYFFNEEVELVTEPDATLSVAITADKSELDAEIDRIKRKLKKLSKKARKLGIALDYDLAA